ncbi:MAG: hypothetical protein ACLRR3_14640 [Eubacterium sp.]
MYDDVEYGLSLRRLPQDSHGNGIAFKWEDEQAETTLFGNISNGVKSEQDLINPVAVFEPVELGREQQLRRASVHNISIMEELRT